MAEYKRFDRYITFTKEKSITSIDVEQIIGFEVSKKGTSITIKFFTPYAPQGAGFVFYKEGSKDESEAELIHNEIFEFLQSKETSLDLNSIDIDTLRNKVERAGKLTRAMRAMR
jgi:hypothetical protein